MYPAQFNLRHFMSHLAPGGYFCLYILTFSLLLLWLLFPIPVETFMAGVSHSDSALLLILFLVFLMICYFVGVALRLPPVDYVELISVEYGLRRRLVAKSRDLPPQLQPVPTWFLKAPWYKKLWTWIWPAAPRFIPFSEVSATLGAPAPTPPADELRDAVRQIAADTLMTPSGTLPTAFPSHAALAAAPNKSFVMEWLWAADMFPYPLWLTYKTLLQTTPGTRRQFQKRLWGVMISTMRGRISAQKTSKEPFNRCKLVVAQKSDRLAAAINDGEALVRMMVGFYFGLSLAAFASALATALLFPLLIYSQIFAALGRDSGLAHGPGFLGIAFVLSVISLAFNAVMKRQVVKNFHVLRMSEAQTAFDSYLIARRNCRCRKRGKSPIPPEMSTSAAGTPSASAPPQSAAPPEGHDALR
jgi:hypothetical protein